MEFLQLNRGKKTQKPNVRKYFLCFCLRFRVAIFTDKQQQRKAEKRADKQQQNVGNDLIDPFAFQKTVYLSFFLHESRASATVDKHFRSGAPPSAVAEQ